MVNIGNVNNAGSERRGLSFLVFIGIIGFSVARGIATFFTNYLWFDSVNLNEVWVKILLTRLGLVGATTTIAFAFIFINLRLATRATPVIDIFEAFDTQDPLARFRSWVSERFARFRLTGALALSLFLGAGSSTLWEQVLLFINQENFNITDPVFNNDISNYIFGLPLYRLFVSWGFQLITLTSIVVVLYFIATGAMQLRPQKLPEVSSGGKAHLSEDNNDGGPPSGGEFIIAISPDKISGKGWDNMLINFLVKCQLWMGLDFQVKEGIKID